MNKESKGMNNLNEIFDTIKNNVNRLYADMDNIVTISIMQSQNFRNNGKLKVEVTNQNYDKHTFELQALLDAIGG